MLTMSTLIAEQLFSFCPRCGAHAFGWRYQRLFVCASCDFHYYVNAGAAGGVIIVDDRGRILLTRRSIDPSKGRLDLPGGFVEFGETAEDAIRREVREELNITLGDLDYLCSFPNRYAHKGVLYDTLDLIFVGRVHNLKGMRTMDEVEEIVFVAPTDVNFCELAFPSIRKALEMYTARAAGNKPRAGASLI